MKLTELSQGVLNRDTGWEFSIDRDGNTIEYRTNSEYEGLFYWCKVRHQWQQELGTGQFSLPKNKSAARQKIVKKFSR